MRLLALLHDVVETLTGDIPKPIKSAMTVGSQPFSAWEFDRLHEAWEALNGVDAPFPDLRVETAVSWADRKLLTSESSFLVTESGEDRFGGHEAAPTVESWRATIAPHVKDNSPYGGQCSPVFGGSLSAGLSWSLLADARHAVADMDSNKVARLWSTTVDRLCVELAAAE